MFYIRPYWKNTMYIHFLNYLIILMKYIKIQYCDVDNKPLVMGYICNGIDTVSSP
jgi:hypothetical protein